jgi:hypothetical protein
MAWSYRKNARNKNGQGNTRLETHFKEANRKTRPEDDVRKDIQKLKIPNWKTLVQDRRRWNWLRRSKLCIKSCRAIIRRSKHLFVITTAMFLSPSALTLAHTTDSIHVWYSDI